MPLVTSLDMQRDARAGGYAIGAFNIENMEMAEAVIQAAEDSKAPVMLQTTPGTLKYAEPAVFSAMVRALAERASVPVAMHLDHGESVEQCARCLHAGYTSIMIDGSTKPLTRNIALTRRVVEICAPCGIPVEGELGRVGGKEDGFTGGGPMYTDPHEAVRFIRQTGVSSLAIGVGTAHGIYKEKPVINLELISTIRSMTSIPLVLHGASGLDDETVRGCISRGICKVNFATELRIAYTKAARATLIAEPCLIDPKKFGAPAREAVYKLTMAKLMLCKNN